MADVPDSNNGEKPDPEKKQPSGRVHLIAIEKLIVHKYTGSAPLLRKADKVAREIIDGELREGEFLQVAKPGRYYLHLPQLRPDAGQLRCSVIVSQIERAIRHLNPTSFHMHEADDGMLASTPDKDDSTDERAPDAKPRSSAPSLSAEDAEMRKTSSEAMKMMITADITTREELIGSELGRFLEENIEIELLPIWNVKSKLISAYECVPIRHGALVSQGRSIVQQFSVGPVEIKAILDTIVYERTCALLKRNAFAQTQALLICPVHASTLDQTRFGSAFLSVGVGASGGAHKSLVFLIKDVKAPISRLRLSDLSRYLRPQSRGLVAEQSSDTGDFGTFKECGFHGMRMNAIADGKSEKRLLSEINMFVEKCEKAKLESFVGGIGTNSLAVGALASGCTYLSGSAIADHATKSGAIETFSLETLFDGHTK